MNAAYLHVLVNHFPLLGTLFGAIVLAAGLIGKNTTLQKTALITFVVTSLFAIAANKTGHEAEEVVEHLSNVSHDLIHEHEEIAETAFILAELLGLLSVVTLFLYNREKVRRILLLVVLVLSLGVFGWMGQTSKSGGKIIHSEFRGKE